MLGHSEACGWFLKLGHLLLLTHWILPWPSRTELISTTKESRTKGLKRRLTWVSLVYTTPDLLRLYRHRSVIPMCPVEDEEHRITTRNQLRRALDDITAERFGQFGWTPESDPSDPHFHWTPEDLLGSAGPTISIESFNIGRAIKPNSKGEVYPLAERGRPPILRLVNKIRDHTLQELDLLFSDLIAAAQLNSESQGSTDNSRSPEHASVSVLNPVSGSDATRINHGQGANESIQNVNQRVASEQTANGNFIDIVSTISDTSSDNPTIDSSSDWSPPKRLRRTVRRRQ